MVQKRSLNKVVVNRQGKVDDMCLHVLVYLYNIKNIVQTMTVYYKETQLEHHIVVQWSFTLTSLY